MSDAPEHTESPASYADRIDPGAEHRRLAEGMATLAGGPAGSLLTKFGVDHTTLSAAREGPQRFKQLVEGLEEVAATLAPLGWIAFGAIPAQDYREAARLAKRGQPGEAESLLVGAWAQRLDLALRPLLSLYQDQDRRRVGLGRVEIMREALDAYRAERFASAILLTLSQIDGVVYDMTGENARTFFATGRKASHLKDQQTLSGHPSGLAVLSAMFTRDRKQTSTDGELRRHGIIHGRELAYGTRLNAMKTLVAFFALLEWAAPAAAAQDDAARAYREQRFAGSCETDEWGRRLDRRGFDDVQRALSTIELYQHARYARVGYAQDVRELERDSEFSSIPGMENIVSDDGRSYRAWAPAEGGLVFGVASQDGDQIGWRYQGEAPPPVEISADPRWHHLFNDEPNPDW